MRVNRWEKKLREEAMVKTKGAPALRHVNDASSVQLRYTTANSFRLLHDVHMEPVTQRHTEPKIQKLRLYCVLAKDFLNLVYII
jgi:hypothetical protein